MAEFIQEGAVLDNQYESDRLLRSYLRRVLPHDEHEKVEADLTRFAHRLLTDIPPMAEDALRHEPRLVQYDPWGRRIDRIDVAHGWKQLERVSAEEGMVAIGYERKLGCLSRVHQFAKLYLFNPSSAVFTCPLAMADGAARAIELYGDDELRQGAFQHLTTRDPSRFWTSGQWMTERAGGSDVSQTQTIARLAEDGTHYRLFGTKWFTSATTSQMTMTLARVADADGNTVPGSRGLSLFYLEIRDAQGRLNGIEIHRLKDKLGTRALPTAELTMNGTLARLVGEPGRGVAQIASLINVTRIYNAISSVAGIRRGIALARDYARRRRAFGKPLAEQPLHVETLADLEVEFQAAFHLAFHAVRLMGRVECGDATPEEAATLRLLIPLVKLYTAKQAVACASETLELFGGAGYVEDTGLPLLLRDAQVLPIWEGTTNILSLDCLRAIEKEQAFEPFMEHVAQRAAAATAEPLADARQRVQQAHQQVKALFARLASSDRADIETAARRLAFSLARTAAGALMLEHAQWSLENGDARDAMAVGRWCRRPLTLPIDVDENHRQETVALAMDMAAVRPGGAQTQRQSVSSGT